MASGGGNEDNPIVLVSPLKLPKSPDSLVKCRWVYYSFSWHVYACI